MVVRNRRRYGGYIVHIGIVIAFVSIAASSSFQTSDDVRMLPGDSTTVDDYELTYVRPTAYRDLDEDRLTFGSVVEVRRDGEVVDTLTPSRNYYSSSSTGTVRSFFEGEATSEVGRSGGAAEDFWTAMRPDLTEPAIDNLIIELRPRDRRAPDPGRCCRTRTTPGGLEDDARDRRGALPAAGPRSRDLEARYEDGEIPVDFRINVNPLVIWIWVGGAIARDRRPDRRLADRVRARRRRVSDVYAARLAKDLSRAS